MKKTICLILVLAAVFTMLSSVAFATSNAFGSKIIYCSPNTERFLNNNSSSEGLKTAGRFYVRHYLWGSWGGSYTNYFKASQEYNGGTLYGGNWMAPDTANYVKSGSLIINKSTYAWGRANTDYGLSYIEITGYSDPNG